MILKETVADLLKKEKRSASWLSKEIGMSVDGFRLSLEKESIKYSSIVQLCGILGVKASLLFGEEKVLRVALDDKQSNDDAPKRGSHSEVIRLLKSQVKDKDLIISMLLKQLEGRG